MKLSFCQYLKISEIFHLNHGKVLSLFELNNPEQLAQDRIQKTQANYSGFSPKSFYPDDIAAACAGLKPAAIIQYIHHPDSPAAQIVKNNTKTHNLDAGAVQSELLKYGFKVRPDFHIAHLKSFYGSDANIIVGGKKEVEQLEKLLQCQHYLDTISSPEIIKKTCPTACHIGSTCKPLHREIGLLLGYPPEEVEEFLKSFSGIDHLPDVKYPMQLPDRMNNYQRKKLW